MASAFEHGVGTHANSECWIVLDGKAKSFSARVGVDDNANNGAASIEFLVFGDGRELWRSGVCKWQDKPRECRVELDGVKILELVVTDAGDNVSFDHANWAEAVFEFDGAAPKMESPPAPAEEAVLLTPPAPAEPRINGPKVYGVRPGSPFLYRIPATGRRPIRFSASGLPDGLTLDADTGIISGCVAQAGTYRVTLTATNAAGEAAREFRIVAGNQLALTPPMGWNSWYIHYHRVSDKVMRQAADQMIDTGMADYGYQYVNIDDCWMVKVGSNDPEIGGPTRDANGRLLTNKRFPDMKAMTDYIHAKGLKAGTYISPGPNTCAGYEGSYGHEAQDAQTFADWGFDFLKYDWCSYGQKAGGNTVEHLKKPYQQMWGEVQKQDRDIVLNLCQYGMGEVWKWGGEVGHCWRTTGDLGLGTRQCLAGLLQHRSEQCPALGVRPPRRVERSGLHPDRLGRRGEPDGRRHEDDAHAQRAIRLYVDVVLDGRPADLQRRHGQTGRLYAERAVQPRGDRGRPGSARQAGPHPPADSPRAGPGQGSGGRLQGGRLVQSRPGAGAAVGELGRNRTVRPAAGPRSVAAAGPGCFGRQVRHRSPAARRRTGANRTKVDREFWSAVTCHRFGFPVSRSAHRLVVRFHAASAMLSRSNG